MPIIMTHLWVFWKVGGCILWVCSASLDVLCRGAYCIPCGTQRKPGHAAPLSWNQCPEQCLQIWHFTLPYKWMTAIHMEEWRREYSIAEYIYINPFWDLFWQCNDDQEETPDFLASPSDYQTQRTPASILVSYTRFPLNHFCLFRLFQWCVIQRTFLCSSTHSTSINRELTTHCQKTALAWQILIRLLFFSYGRLSSSLDKNKIQT